MRPHTSYIYRARPRSMDSPRSRRRQRPRRARRNAADLFVPHTRKISGAVRRKICRLSSVARACRCRGDLEAIADGTVDVVATDHCSWPLQRKTEPDRFTRIPPGMSNLETLVPMLYSEGVVKRRITLEKMVELVASYRENFRALSSKGAIIEGADADLIVLDPNAKVVVRAAKRTRAPTMIRSKASKSLAGRALLSRVAS